MNDRGGRQDCSDALATNDTEAPTSRVGILACCRSRQDEATEREQWRNEIEQEMKSTGDGLSLERELDAAQKESVVAGTAASCESVRSASDEATTTHCSFDGKVPTQSSTHQSSEGYTFADELEGCYQRRGAHSHRVEAVIGLSIKNHNRTDSTTHLRSTQSQINEGHPATLSSWDRHRSDFVEQNPESLPTEVPTAGARAGVASKSSNDETAADGIATTTYLVPFVSQSAKSELTTHSGTTEWHANRSSGAGGGHTSSVPYQVGVRSSTGLVPPTPLPDDVVATWERALAVTLASSSYSSTSPMATLSSSKSSTHAINAESLHPPSSRLSGVMCRSNDAVHVQSQLFPLNRREGELGLSFGFDSPGQVNSKAWLGSADRKHSKTCGRFAVFALIVSLVTGVTIVGAVFASRGPSPASDSPSQRLCISNETAASLLPAVRAINDIRNDNVVLQEWRSSLKSGSAFGELVSLSKDGRIMAVAERVNITASAVYIMPTTSKLQPVDRQSVVFLEAAVTSLALNNDGTVFAVGLSTGLTEVYKQEWWCTFQWKQMGDSIRQQGGASLSQSSQFANFTTSVSLSGDGTVVAVGLVTSSQAAHYQVLRFQKGKWKPMGPAVEYGDDGSFAHTSARVSLSANCTSESTSPCILAISRMFSYEQFSFGMVSVRKSSQGDTSWDTLGQAIPFALEEATVELALNGTRLSVSDVASTTVYSLSNNGTRVEWAQLGQHIAPRASSVAMDEAGWRLTLSVNNTVSVFELQQGSSNESIGGFDWNMVHQIPIQTSKADEDAANSFLRLAIGHGGDRLVAGDPFYTSPANESSGRQGRVIVMGF